MVGHRLRFVNNQQKLLSLHSVVVMVIAVITLTLLKELPDNSKYFGPYFETECCNILYYCKAAIGNSRNPF